MSPFPGMDEVDGKGDGIAVGPVPYNAKDGMDENPGVRPNMIVVDNYFSQQQPKGWLHGLW